MFHASRKTFSNVKASISDQWRDSSPTSDKEYNLKPDDRWNKNQLFDTEDDAKLFLGVLDAVFLGAYSLVRVLMGPSTPENSLESEFDDCLLRDFS